MKDLTLIVSIPGVNGTVTLTGAEIDNYLNRVRTGKNKPFKIVTIRVRKGD